MACWSKPPVFVIDLKYCHIVAFVICGDQKAICWIDFYIPRPFSTCWLVSNVSKFSRMAVNPENRDTVVAAIGAVKEISVGHDLDIRSIIFAIKRSWQCFNCLSFMEGTRDAVVDKGCKGSVELVQ